MSLCNEQGQECQKVRNVRSLPMRGAAIAGHCSSAGTPHQKAAHRQQGREYTLYFISLTGNPEKNRGKQMHKKEKYGLRDHPAAERNIF